MLCRQTRVCRGAGVAGTQPGLHSHSCLPGIRPCLTRCISGSLGVLPLCDFPTCAGGEGRMGLISVCSGIWEAPREMAVFLSSGPERGFAGMAQVRRGLPVVPDSCLRLASSPQRVRPRPALCYLCLSQSGTIPGRHTACWTEWGDPTFSEGSLPHTL